LGTLCIGLRANPTNSDLIRTAVFQFILSFVLFGWIWSIWWGIVLVQKSRDEQSPDSQSLTQNEQGYGAVNRNQNQNQNQNQETNAKQQQQ
jgi:hypothetical protein